MRWFLHEIATPHLSRELQVNLGPTHDPTSSSRARENPPERPGPALVPWAILKDPQFLGSVLQAQLAYHTKPHYMADILQTLCWGLICGRVRLPYSRLFVPMIIHCAVRDDARCAEIASARTGIIKRVPYVFVPGLV